MSLILNYPIGNIVINNLDKPNPRNARQEVVDGKQRLTTILKFVQMGNVSDEIVDTQNSWFRLSQKVSNQAKEVIKKAINGNDPEGVAKMDRAKRLSFEDLPQSIQDSINSYNVPIYTMQAADPAQIRDYFKVLQNQEKLRAGEIINALPDSVLSPYYRRLDTVSFLNKIHYKDSNRNDFEKLYCTLLGMWFGKVQINSENKKTIEFVENLKNLTGEQIQCIEALNQAIESIGAMPSQLSRMRVTMRSMELLLGLALRNPGYYDTNILSKVEYICSLSAKLAAFRSSESEEVAFAKYFGDEYTCNKENFIKSTAPQYRKLFNATSMSTSKAAFIEVLDDLRTRCDLHCKSL